MANAPTRTYALTDKQVRVIADALSIQIRFFNKHLRDSDLRYIKKVKDALNLKNLKSSHARPVFQEQDCLTDEGFENE